MATTKITTPELFDFSDLNTALQLPSGDTASRPTSPSGGEWRFNTELKYVEYYDTSKAKWYQIETEELPVVPANNFQTTIYTGNSTARSITGTNFTPDLVWIKMYSTGASDHTLFDSLRGTNNLLQSNNNNGEQTFANTLTSFNSPPTGGFSLGTDFRVNNIYDYVAWQWRAGGAPNPPGTTNSNAAGLAPTLGSVMIDDVQSTTALSGSLAATNITANTNLAFSIVTYTGTGSNETVDHGLGQTPSVIIVKNLGMVSADWIVGSNVITPYDFNYHMNLNNNSLISSGTNFNNTNPTSTVFSVKGSDNTTGAVGNYVAYCFASAAGLSKIDFYAGNSGTQNIPLGFTPGFVMIKSVSAASSWNIIDNKRPGGYTLYAEDSVGENDESSLVGLAGTGAAGEIQLKAASGNYNQSGREYLYMAFAG
jgi:hypothetical protein